MGFLIKFGLRIWQCLCRHVVLVLEYNNTLEINMNKSIILAVLSASMMASGCVSTELYKSGVLVNKNGKPTEPGHTPVVHPEATVQTVPEAIQTVQPAEQPKAKKSYQKYEIVYNYDAPVDLVARKIQHEFGYLDYRGVKRQFGKYYETKLRSRAYRWEQTPGSYYNMRDSIPFGKTAHVVDFEIFGNGDGKTRVITSYWIRSDQSHRRSDVKRQIKDKVNNALLPYVG